MRFSVEFRVQRGELVGRIHLPKDDTVTLEALAEVVQRFSDKTGLPPAEILNDVLSVIGKS